ncbi:hypothetical protein PCANB_000975 [Pneumocystis canis]|nr:hypothetical protein PCANB_000975 [Pneumocystis canis]
MERNYIFSIKNELENIEILETEKRLKKEAKLIEKIDFYKNIEKISLLKDISSPISFNGLYGTEPFGSDMIAYIVKKAMSKNYRINKSFDNQLIESKDNLKDKNDFFNDIWLEEDILYYPKQMTWDMFKNPLSKPYINPFISEKSMHVFDLLLVKELNHIYSPQEAGIIVDPFLLRKCLLLLSLGESSSLFAWDKKLLKFLILIENLKVTGCTKESTKSIIDFFLSMGTHTSRLRLFIDSFKKNTLNHDPCVLAFVACITEILKNYSNILVSDLNDIKEPLLLLEFIEKYIYIEEGLRKLSILCHRDLETFPEPPFPEIKQGIQLLNVLYTFVYKNLYTSTENILLISKFLLKYSSQPWLKMLEQWVGFQKKTPNETKLWKKNENSVFFIYETNISYLENDINLNECFKMNDVDCFYLPKSFFQNVYDIGKSIRLLYKIQPNHPLCKILHNEKIEQSDINIQLEWRFYWENINDFIKKIKKYKEIMETEIEKFENLSEYHETINLKEKEKSKKNSEKSEFKFWGYSKQEISDSIKKSIIFFESEITNKDILPFDNDINAVHYKGNIAPIDIIPMNCFMMPLIVQSTLVNNSIMKLFLKDIGLKHHLSLLWKVKLFDDGLFIQNLSYALFGYTLEHNKYSLELNSKSGFKEWPPKSAELIIALRTILTDTFGSDFFLNKQKFETKGTLLERLSFSVREIDESEFEKIKDPYNIEALDFLKIVYTPPFPLDEIITDSCLIKYDQLTNFLLRLIRMNNVITKLFEIKTNKQMFSHFKITLRFRFHARYFIYTFFFYIFNILLPMSRQKLNKHLKDIELNLSHSSPLSLAHFHSEILDYMLFSCFLTSSQISLIRIITDIFSIILKFSKVFFQYQSSSILAISDIDFLISITNTLYSSLTEHISNFIQKIHCLDTNKGICTELAALFETKDS